MATPGQLVQTMAETLGVPAETVTNYDRVLSENGMRSKSGRGRGAAKVTAGDAANLLIAIMGSPIAGASVKEAANSCRTYGSLPGFRTGKISFAKLGLMVDELPKKHTLHDSLSALIDSAAKPEHFRWRWPVRKPRDFFVIRLDGPRPLAEISASGDLGEGFQVANYGYARERPREEDDLRQSRIVTYRTIRALGSLLAKGND